MSLTKVTFWEPVEGNAGWIVIRDDLDMFNICDANSNEVWNSNGTIEPAAYVSGTTAQVSAAFNVICNGPAGQKFYVKAEHPDGYHLPVQELVEQAGKWNYLQKAMIKNFPVDDVGFWENFELTWYWSNSQTGPWGKIKTSNNPLYVTHDIPILVPPTQAFHTLVYLGCKNATGQYSDKAIVNAMYTEFMDRKVRKVNGTVDMTYWGPTNAPEPACWVTAGLLEYEDGRCGAWAHFFNDMIRIQGIPYSAVSEVKWGNGLSSADETLFTSELNSVFTGVAGSIIFYEGDTPGSKDSYFWVKNWNFTNVVGPVIGGGNNNFYLSERDLNNVYTLTLANGNTIKWAAQAGTAGQNNSDPKSEFTNHGIVKYDGDYYDPSYGTIKQNTANNWETTSLQGFGTKIRYVRLEGNMLKTYEIIWNGHSNDLSPQTTVIP